MPALRLRCAAAFIALLLGLPSAALAGPVVTFVLKDGRKIEADVQMFYNDRFSIRDRQTHRLTEIDASSIRIIDFGETPAPETSTPPPARPPLTLANLRTMAEAHHFEELLRTLGNMAAVRLKRFDAELALELERADLKPEARRDLGLAKVLSLWTMGQEDSAKTLFAKIRAEHPDDAVVRDFDAQMRKLKAWAADQPPLPLPEKKP